MPKSKIATWTGWFIVAAAMVIGVIGSFGYASHARFHSRIEQLKLNGELVSLDDQIYIVEDEKDDAITYLKRASAPAHDLFLKSPYVDSEIHFKDSVSDFEKLYRDNQDVFENINKAIAAPEASVVFDMQSDKFLSALHMHKIGFLLGWKGQVHNAKGEFNDAAKTAIDLMKLAEMSETTTLINSLLSVSLRAEAIHIACEAVSSNDVDDDVVDTICQMLERTDPLASFKSALKTERSISVFYLINPELQYNTDFEPDFKPSGFDQLTAMIPTGAVMMRGNGFLDQIGKAIEDSELPPSNQLPRQDTKWSIKSVFGIDDYQPAYKNMRNSFGESLTKIRAARIVIALQTSDDAIHRDSWPEDYLVSIGVPREMTVDPYTDKTMIIQRENNQWLVYSNGLKPDDGNEVETAKKIGAFPN